jgi:transcriptional regulator with XRE-family HTH domain
MTLREARRAAGLSLRELAERGGTSHATVAAYEAGRKTPGVDTFLRLLRASGREIDASLRPAVGGVDAGDRGRELIAVLELAAMFPATHTPTLTAPVFGRPAPRVRPTSRVA